MTWAVAGLMYPSRPVVRPDSLSILLMLYAAKHDGIELEHLIAVEVLSDTFAWSKQWHDPENIAVSLSLCTSPRGRCICYPLFHNFKCTKLFISTCRTCWPPKKMWSHLWYQRLSNWNSLIIRVSCGLYQSVWGKLAFRMQYAQQEMEWSLQLLAHEWDATNALKAAPPLQVLIEALADIKSHTLTGNGNSVTLIDRQTSWTVSKLIKLVNGSLNMMQLSRNKTIFFLITMGIWVLQETSFQALKESWASFILQTDLTNLTKHLQQT